MRPAKLIFVLWLACGLIACSTTQPEQGFSDQIARAKAAHEPILIYASSFSYYYNSDMPRKRVVSFFNTSGKVIDTVLLTVSKCGAKGGIIEGGRYFTLKGPFKPHAHYTVESNPTKKIYSRFVIRSIEIRFANGQKDIHEDDIRSMLTANLANFCPVSTF
jgi:hypothetical protein